LHPPPAAFSMAESIIAELHGRLLRGIAAETAVHFQGLRAAAGHLRRAGVLDSKLAKKLAAVDCAFAISRHITAVSSEQCVDEVLAAIRCSTKKKNLEQVANEKLAKDKVDEEKAHEKEQAAAHKVLEEEYAAKMRALFEMAAMAQLAVEGAALQQAAAEEACNAANKVLADRDLQAKEEQAAKEEAEQVRIALSKVVPKEFDSFEKYTVRLAEVTAKRVKAEEEAAEVKRGGVATGPATGEKAAKQPKVGSFAKADMELEALAYRIDEMPSAAEELRWRGSGWR
jgi:hypothetical protein